MGAFCSTIKVFRSHRGNRKDETRSHSQPRKGNGKRKSKRAAEFNSNKPETASYNDNDETNKRRQQNHPQTKDTRSPIIACRKNTVFGYDKDFDERYSIGKLLGHGQFGYTFVAVDKKNGDRVAVKRIEKNKMLLPVAIEDVKREVKILQELSGHENVVHFHNAFEDDFYVYIVMELCKGGELLDRILSKKDSRYTEKDAAVVVRQMLKVVAECHLHGLVHRDLKPENFLFKSTKEDSPLKATDFGLSDFIKPGTRFKDIVGSAYYVAPEVLKRKSGPESDVWSIGVITYILLSGRRPFWDKTEDGIFKEVLKNKPDFQRKPWSNISSSAKDFIKKLLVKDPRARLTAAQALSHPWVREGGDASEIPIDISVLSNMRRFVKYSRLKQLALRALASTLDDDELADLRDQFDAIDVDKNGSISLEEMRQALAKDLPWKLKESCVLKIVQAIDGNTDGLVDFSEFVAAALHVHQLKEHDSDKWQQRSQAAFEKFDIDRDGFITPEELRLAYEEVHDEIWLEYAVSCFLQGIKFGVSNCRSHLARVLYLLSFDTPNETVGRQFDKYMEQIPHWIWLHWIPQLLLSLQRIEAPHCKFVLLKIASVYPQALYYWLRTYLLERRDVANKSELGRLAIAQQNMQLNLAGAGAVTLGVADGRERNQCQGGPTLAENLVHQVAQSGGGTGSHEIGSSRAQDLDQPNMGEKVVPGSGNDQTAPQPGGGDQASQKGSLAAGEGAQGAVRRNAASTVVASAVTAFEAAKDIMDTLRCKHTNMASELEVLLTEIGSRFVTLPEERLLAVVNALLHRCYKYPTATTAEVPQSLKKELSGVCRACFSADAVNKHIDFVNEYKYGFECDLNPESAATFPSTLSELTERLKHWKTVLQNNVEDRFPAILKLEEESRLLRDLHVVDIELPGQYLNHQEIAPDHTVKLDKVASDIPIVRRHGSSFRRLTLIGSDGSHQHFIVQTSLTPNARSDERILQVFRVMNQMFDKHKESRNRHLFVHTPIIIPVWSQVRMVEDDVTYNTFLEVYENHCARNNKESDLPINYFKEHLNHSAASLQVLPDAIVDLRFQAYQHITQNLVTDGIFSQHMYKTLPSSSHMWVFKKQFAIQLALSCFISFILQIGGRSPNKILFAKNSGRIFQTDFHPAYDANGMIEFNEPVPFRLTRNMQAFFSHFGVEGLIVSSITAAAQAVVSAKQIQHLWHQFAMFFRDELLSLSWRRPLGMPLAHVSGLSNMNPSEFKHKVGINADCVVHRAIGIALAPISDEEENNVDVPQSVQKGVEELVEAALCPKNLCMMDPTWHPWF